MVDHLSFSSTKDLVFIGIVPQTFMLVPETEEPLTLPSFVGDRVTFRRPPFDMLRTNG